jgi:CheY-like chemotaxis protein
MSARILTVDDDPASPAPPTLLLVDDDRFMLDLLADFLAADDWRILAAQSGPEGLDLLARHQVQVILCDQCMPGMSGTEFAQRVRERHPHTWRIIVSGQSEAGPIAQALADGVIDGYLAKPWPGAVLRATVAEAFRLQRTGLEAGF